MPNHWHLLLWPRRDGELSEFMRLLTVTHTQRWHAHRQTAGTGPVYQGRFKSFPVQSDEHFLTAARYVEGNALRAGLVKRAEDWLWCSLWRRRSGTAAQRALLSSWPVAVPRRWLQLVNEPAGDEALQVMRNCVQRGRPLGEKRWQVRTARRLGIEQALRPLGRPRKNQKT
jgi:putative transposase